MLDSSHGCFTTTGTTPHLFASAINFLVASQCFVTEKLLDYTGDQERFDFIVVGGGSAGSVVANRLSEIPHWNVLLLEAGPEPPIESDIPNMDITLYKSKYDWQYSTENDGVTHQALKGGSVYWPRGKMLGGSSSINAMIYIRGRDSDFEAWVKEGNPNWTPENVNFYFRKAENLQSKDLLKDKKVSSFYGHHGPLVVNTYNSTYRKITEEVIDSLDVIGFREVDDLNSAKFKGHGISGILTTTVDNGRRCSTYRAYIAPFQHRKNLKVVTNAFVTKILLNENNEAYGVEADINGKKKTFYSNIEVIVSGGSINTPQLLMLSGIGACDHLQSKNIHCKVNLPGVGQNLQDHNYIQVPIYADEPGPQSNITDYLEAVKYMFDRSGALAQSSYSDVTTFFSRNKSMEYPEFQSHLVVAYPNESKLRKYFPDYLDDTLQSIMEPSKTKALYLFAVHLLHPFSRGSIQLKSSNPYDHPIINASYFGDDRDLQATAEGIQMLTKIADTPYFKSINAFVHRVRIPQCNHFVFQSNEYWRCYVMHTGLTVYHPVGTAKMGPSSVDAVVNNFLKVYGTKKLRVIDASVMPTLTSGNTNAPTIMIGEMGSDMIKFEHLGHVK